MDSSNKRISDAAAMAQFRFALIAPVIHGLYPDASRNAYYRRVTEKPLTLPDGSVFQYSPKTLSKWVSLYQNGGIDALMPRERSDKGSTRVLPDTAVGEIYRLREAFPRLNATQIHRHLVEEAFIPASVSVCAVQRFVKKHDLKSARNPSMRDRKAFEEDAFGKMWQADTCYLPYITENGQRRRVYCIMIIDDHSRFLVGGGLFYNDNAYNFQKVLKAAVAAYGIPAKLYVDNGCSYVSGQLSLICGSIGTILLHTKVRDGASKAKIERQFRTLKETWLYTLDLDSITSLEQFDGLLKDYMRSYNTSLHSGIGCTPLKRYQKTRSGIRTPGSGEWLEECFLNRITRKVNRDSTVSIDRVSYDVPMQFISSKVKMLMNYGYDSLNCFTLILCGEPHLNNTLKKPVHEALRQRVTVHYNFSGLFDQEVGQYVLHKIACAGGAASIIDQAALSAVHSHSQGSPRLVDNLMTHALTLGAQMGKKSLTLRSSWLPSAARTSVKEGGAPFMEYTCILKNGSRKETWAGKLTLLRKSPGQYEAGISGRGTYFHIPAGRHKYGHYLCIPNHDVGCGLSDLSDLFWNEERLCGLMQKVDAVTVATGLVHLSAMAADDI